MAVEVFSLVTAKIDANFLNTVVMAACKDHSVIKQLLSGMSSNLKCWRSDDGTWQLSGCLNNVVEAGANLLALYMRAQAAARDNNSSIDISLAETTSGTDIVSLLEPFVTKTEHFDDGEEGLGLSAADTSRTENRNQLQPVETGRNENTGPRTRQSTRQAARKQVYLHHKSYNCRMCKKSFSSSTNLRRHVRANHETGRFQCQHCPAAFKRCDSLLRHRRTAHADLQCTNCRKVFRNVEAKSSHVCKGRSRDKLSCTVCRKSFISRSNLNKHIRLTHGAIVFPCKQCGKIFRQSDSLTLHTWKSHRLFICPQCGSVHETADLLCKHMSSVHGKNVDEMSTMERSPSPEKRDDSLNMNDASDGDDGNDVGLPDAEDGAQETLIQANGEASFLDEISALVISQGANLVRKNKTKDSVVRHRTGQENLSTQEHSSRTNSCRVCGKSFSSESNLRRHIRVNHEASQFPCQECSAVFRRIDSLVRHKRANHAELCCSVCHAVFNSAEAKTSHDCTRPSERKLSCDVCGKSFANRSNLNKHSYLVHGGVKFHCDQCPKFFRRSMTLTLHMWKSHNRFTCPQCNSVLETAALLCDHMSSVHGRKVTKNLAEICRRPVNRPIAVANCTRCNKMFSSRSNLAKHIRVVHGHPRSHCTMCERSFTSDLQLTLHIRTFHQHLPLKCSKCPAEFTRQKSYLLHQRNVHHCDRNFQCETCGRAFLFETNLLRHQQQHHCSAVHLCEQCGAEFTTNYRLRRHVRVEHEGLRYMCSVCGAQFRSDGKRREHEIARHTALKPRQCRHCGAAFARYSSLSRHLRQCRVGKPIVTEMMPPHDPTLGQFQPVAETSTIDNFTLLVPAVLDTGASSYLARPYPGKLLP